MTHWTARYLLTLCVGLLVIGVISTFWIRYAETERRLDIMRLMAEEIADRVVNSDGNLHVTPMLVRIMDSRQQHLEPGVRVMMLILDQDRNLLLGPPAPRPLGLEVDQLLAMEEESGLINVTRGEGSRYLAVKRAIEIGPRTVGWVVLLSPDRGIAQNPAELKLLAIMLGSLALLGWLVIYLLTRKLAMPIKEVANAAKEIVAGNYDVRLDRDIREQELYELIESFKDMADRLGKLERMRSEMLAGVTHELKTPVTSISGLIQAVKDGVVSGEEAREFLEMGIRETRKLQQMVEDLLEFNSFAVGEVHLRREPLAINRLLREIVHQWQIAQDDVTFQLELAVPEQDVYATVDPLRVQQIVYNLLNNARQAIGENGVIQVSMRTVPDVIQIEVKDNGPGIPPEERPLIFEKFFRGEQKKHQVRGLGLGLPFSRIMARAMGGDLRLTESSEAGTTMTLVLPRT